MRYYSVFTLEVHVAKEYGSKVSYKYYKEARYESIQQKLNFSDKIFKSTQDYFSKESEEAVIELASIDEAYVDVTQLVDSKLKTMDKGTDYHRFIITLKKRTKQ